MRRVEAPFFIYTYGTDGGRRTPACGYNWKRPPMVRDGYYYGLALIAAAVLLGWLTTPPWAIIPLLPAVFFLWLFRDPERVIPQEPGALVSPADGKVTDVAVVNTENGKQARISEALGRSQK